MTEHKNPFRIPLPRGWPQHARSAMLHVISLAQFALAYTRGWAVNSQVARVRLKAENDRLRQQAAWLTEEIRIKDARMSLTAAQRRPHYAPHRAHVDSGTARCKGLVPATDSRCVSCDSSNHRILDETP